MTKLIISLLVVLGLTLSGCDQVKLPDWLQFGRTKQGPARTTKGSQGQVLLSVNSRVVTLEDFNERLEAFNDEIQASGDIPDSVKETYLITTVEGKKRLLDEIVKTELLIDAAIERGLDRREDVTQAVKALKEQLLLAKIIEVERDNVDVSAQEIEDFYSANQRAFTVAEERRVSLILVSSEAKAKRMLIQLLQGVNFADLAQTNSIDSSASSGGDVGFITKRSSFSAANKKTMFEKFENVAFSLELNKSSAIFKGPQGYYLIKVTEIKPVKQLELSEVYEDIKQGLTLQQQDEALTTLLANLRRAGNVIVHESLLE